MIPALHTGILHVLDVVVYPKKANVIQKYKVEAIIHNKQQMT